MTKFVELQDKIKAFTQTKPTNNGITDTDYKAYLAECARLLDIDLEMCSLKNDTYSDEYVKEQLVHIEKDINEIVYKRIREN